MNVLPYTRGDLWCILVATREVSQGPTNYVSAFKSSEGGGEKVYLKDSKFSCNGGFRKCGWK